MVVGHEHEPLARKSGVEFARKVAMLSAALLAIGVALEARSAWSEPGAALTVAAEVATTPGRIPTPERLALLRHDVRQRAVRLHLGGDAFEVREPSFDSSGVTFDAALIEGVPRWVAGEKLRPRMLESPVAWSRVESIDRRGGGVGRGAAIGMLVLPLIVYAIPSNTRGTSDDFSVWYAIASIPVGALAGAIVGAATPTWTRVWHRPNSAGEENP